MECISDSIARCHVAKSANADPFSYDVGSPASVKKIPGEYLSGGCDSRSDLRGMTGLVAPGVGVGWSKAESFSCAASVDSVRECSVTRGTDSCCGLGHHEGLALRKTLPSDFNRPFVEHVVQTSDDLSVLRVPESVSELAVSSIPKENAIP